MKGKQSLDRVVTESILEDTLHRKKVITEQSLEAILNKKQYVTESILEKSLALFKDELMLEIRDLFVEWSSKMFERIDPLLREIETAREDREIGTYQMGKISNTVDDHEERIRKLESN